MNAAEKISAAETGPDDEPGTDLSNRPGEVHCFLCGVWVDNTSYGLHVAWHDGLVKPPPITSQYDSTSAMHGIYPGMPVEQSVNILSQKIQMLQNDKWMLETQLTNAIAAIEKTIGTEGKYRFMRDWNNP